VLCAFCDHRNPGGAHFCNECGARLDLTQCWLCEAVNDRSAVVCHKCNAPLTEPMPAVAPIVPQAITVAVEPSVTAPPARKRLLPGVALATVCFVALAAGAMYFATRTEPPALHDMTAASPAPEAASPAPETSQPDDAAMPVGAAEAPASEDKPGSEPAVIEAGNASPEGTAVTQTAPRPSAQKRVEKATRARPAQREPNRVAGAPRSLLTTPPRNTVPNSQRTRRCTDAVAALGLCSRDNPERSQ
jgi:Double zinc ribbon